MTESGRPESGIERPINDSNSCSSNFKAEALTSDHLRLQTPSIFAQEPMSGLSSRYTLVPTTEIISGLREKNWLPVNVEQQRVRIAKRFGFLPDSRPCRTGRLLSSSSANSLWTRSRSRIFGAIAAPDRPHYTCVRTRSRKVTYVICNPLRRNCG
jgi:hypothetical protein